MPSLLRFLVVVGLLAGLIYGAIYALASFVEPTPREMTVTVPRDTAPTRVRVELTAVQVTLATVQVVADAPVVT